MDGFEGNLTASFDASGYSNTCPNDDNIEQAEETSFCGDQTCGYKEGVFCGLCDVTVAASSEYMLAVDERPIFRVAEGNMPESGRLSFEASDGSEVRIAALVGPDRRLVTRGGASQLGVRIADDNTIELDDDAGRAFVTAGGRRSAQESPSPELLVRIATARGVEWVRQKIMPVCPQDFHVVRSA